MARNTVNIVTVCAITVITVLGATRVFADCSDDSDCARSTLIVLGTFSTQEATQALAERLDASSNKRLLNPFNDKPFDSFDVVGFGITKPNYKAPLSTLLKLPLELVRVTADHIGVHLLTPIGRFSGNYRVVICHSNGCTSLIDAVRRGQVHADFIYAFGTDWTSVPIREHELHGAKLTFFVLKGDPIPHIPAPIIEAKDDTIFLKFGFFFDKFSEIPKAAWDYLVHSRSGSHEYILLPRPENVKGVHGFVETYFPAVKQYMRTAPTELAVRLRVPFETPVALRKRSQTSSKVSDREQDVATGVSGNSDDGTEGTAGSGGTGGIGASGPGSGGFGGSPVGTGERRLEGSRQSRSQDNFSGWGGTGASGTNGLWSRGFGGRPGGTEERGTERSQRFRSQDGFTGWRDARESGSDGEHGGLSLTTLNPKPRRSLETIDVTSSGIDRRSGVSARIQIKNNDFLLIERNSANGKAK